MPYIDRTSCKYEAARNLLCAQIVKKMATRRIEGPLIDATNVTPDPTDRARSTSAGANGHVHFKELAKDTLICALDALAQSSDAFSPLKSVAGGLMFFATLADVSTHTVSNLLY